MRSIAFLYLFFFCIPVFCQKVLTMDEAIASALNNNYEIRLLRNDSFVFALNNSYAWAAFLPRLNATSSLLFNNNNLKQKLADGTEKNAKGLQSSNLNNAVNLNWTLFNGLGMFATRQRLAEQVKLGELNIRHQVVATVTDIIKTYYNIVQQKQQLIAIREQMKLNEERVSQAEKKLSVGLGAKPELLQSKLDLNAQKAAILTQLNLIEQLKEQLDEKMAIEPGIDYDVADSIPVNRDLVIADTYSFADSNNPAMQVAKQNIKVAQITLRERKADRFPTISFNSAYNFSQTKNQAVVNNFTPLFNRNQGFNYGLSASIPIFNGYTVRRQIREAEIGIEYRKIQLNYTSLHIHTAITAAFRNYEMQIRTLALEEENIQLAKENVYIASERLRLGITTVLELREAQKSLQDAFSRLISARYNTKVAETDLLQLRGDLMK